MRRRKREAGVPAGRLQQVVATAGAAWAVALGAHAQCRAISGETVVNAAGSPFKLATAGCVQRTAAPATAPAPLSPLLRLYEPPGASVDVVLHGKRVRRPAPPPPVARAIDRPSSATVTVPRERAERPPVTRKVFVRPRYGVVAARTSVAPSARAYVYAPAIYGVARAYNIDPAFMGAVIRRESGFNPGARSGKGAQGFMQVMPGTAARFGVGREGLSNPVVNLAVGARYLKSLQHRYGNNLPLILAAYNAGEGAVDRHGRRIPPYRETQAYVGGILGDYGGTLRRRAVAR